MAGPDRPVGVTAFRAGWVQSSGLRHAEVTAEGSVRLEFDNPQMARIRPDAFWGARYAIVQEPDGNDVGLMSPHDPAQTFTP